MTDSASAPVVAETESAATVGLTPKSAVMLGRTAWVTYMALKDASPAKSAPISALL